MGRSEHDLLRDALIALDYNDCIDHYRALREEIREALSPGRLITEGSGHVDLADRDPALAMRCAADKGLRLLTDFWHDQEGTVRVLHHWECI